MSDENAATERPEYPTSFGIFYPVGYIVVGLESKEDAQRVQQDLITGGYVPEDCALFSCKEVKEAARRNLDENPTFLPRLSWADKAVKIHLEAAKEGASFLVIYAPHKIIVDRAMNVIRRVPYVFVHRYHRLAIEEVV